MCPSCGSRLQFSASEMRCGDTNDQGILIEYYPEVRTVHAVCVLLLWLKRAPLFGKLQTFDRQI